MKNKDKKITEKRLKSIIRSAILKEFRQARTSQFTWGTCDKIDLPDGFISNEAGREAIKKAEKTAALAAQFYGIPGSFCNIFNSLFGDNPEKDYKSAVDKGKSQKVKGSKVLAYDLYSDEFEHLKSKSSKFIKTMADNIATPKSDSIAADKLSYEDMMRDIRESSALSSDPLSVVDNINGILGISDKGTRKKVSKLAKEESIDDHKVIAQLVSSSQLLLRSITGTNLRSSSIRSAYNTFPDYERFLNLTDSY